MENGDALYARIAELEKENDILRGKYSDLWHYGLNGRDEFCEINIVKMLLEEGNKERVMEVWSDVYEDVSEFNEDSEDEDSEDEEVLDDLTCDQLRDRLRAINKPVGWTQGRPHQAHT